MNKEDIEFLKNLQHEMITQDTVGQADPRFWVVQEMKKDYGIEEGFEDGWEINNENFETVAYYEEEFCKYINDTYEYELSDKNMVIKYDDCCDYMLILDKEEYEETNDADNCIMESVGIKEFIDWIKDNLDVDYYIIYYKEEYKTVPDTMFLTLKECREHIQRNHYHYNNPRPYAMTAWRSPQVERLYKILQNTNWEELEVK